MTLLASVNEPRSHADLASHSGLLRHVIWRLMEQGRGEGRGDRVVGSDDT